MIEALFDRAKSDHRAAFIPYVMAGDPDLETSLAILGALTEAGVDAIELGIPYGDPLADGPTIAAAAQRALEHGTRMEDALDLVRRHKRRAALRSFSSHTSIRCINTESSDLRVKRRRPARRA